MFHKEKNSENRSLFGLRLVIPALALGTVSIANSANAGILDRNYPQDEPAYKKFANEFMFSGISLHGLGESCSGSLIDPRVVLLAAHCVESLGPQNRQVLARNGSFGLYRNGEQKPELQADIIDVVVHPGYRASLLAGNPADQTHDIALAYLYQIRFSYTLNKSKEI